VRAKGAWPKVEPVEKSPSEPSACARLALTAERVGRLVPDDARRFLVALGKEVAGVRRGPLALVDLAHGGRTKIAGTGFRPELSDGSRSQARHFVGVARSVTVLGPALTVWVSEHLRRDARTSADGRLSLLAVEFARELMSGRLPVDAAAGWIRSNLCDGCRR